MKQAMLEVAKEDLPEVEALAKEKDLYLVLKLYFGEVWDEVFYPTKRKKLVYVVPERRVLFCLVSGFKWHGELVEKARKAGIEVGKVVVKFL